jgi:uncharacterized protein
MQGLDFQTQVRPDTLARERAMQMGLVAIDQLPRFASAVESSEPLEISLQYAKDIEGVYIDSVIKVKCQLLCEFCLSIFTFSLHSKSRFRPVLTLEATREISQDDEPILYEDGFINTINMIEDDVLLAIPNYPRCSDCMGDDNKADTFPSQFDIIPNLAILPE